MLGVRLDPELEQMLERVADTQNRSKSEIARQAIRRYVEAHDVAFQAKISAQLKALAALPWTDDDQDWAEMAAPWDDPKSRSADAAE